MPLRSPDDGVARDASAFLSIFGRIQWESMHRCRYSVHYTRVVLRRCTNIYKDADGEVSRYGRLAHSTCLGLLLGPLYPGVHL